MKKVFILILTLMISLSLCACGGDKSQIKESSSTNEETAPTTEQQSDNETVVETEPELRTLHMNETVTVDDYEFTITKTEYVDGWNPTGKLISACSSGNVHFVVYYNFKNIGKTESSVPHNIFTLIYGDGYEFTVEDTYHYSFDVSTYVANASELPILSEAKPCQSYFEIPMQVKDDLEAPLKIMVRINGQEFEYNLRPIDEQQKEAYLAAAVNLIEESEFWGAIPYLEEISGYKDSSELLNRCEFNTSLYSLSRDERKEYIAANTDSLISVSGDELKSIIIGKYWEDSTARTWTFYEDGTIDDGFNYRKYGYGDFKRDWSIKNNCLTYSACSSSGTAEYTDYEVYKLVDDRLLEDVYVLISEEKSTFLMDRN